MSVRNSSWCCCSWLMPSSISAERLGGKVRQRTLERFVDVSAPVAHFVERRTAEHPALRPRRAARPRLVIAVEEVGEALVERRGSPAHDRAARRSRRTRSCARDAIWRARHRGKAGSSRRRRDSGAARSSVSCACEQPRRARPVLGRKRPATSVLRNRSQRVAPGCHSTSPPSLAATMNAPRRTDDPTGG